MKRIRAFAGCAFVMHNWATALMGMSVADALVAGHVTLEVQVQRDAFLNEPVYAKVILSPVNGHAFLDSPTTLSSVSIQVTSSDYVLHEVNPINPYAAAVTLKALDDQHVWYRSYLINWASDSHNFMNRAGIYEVRAVFKARGADIQSSLHVLRVKDAGSNEVAASTVFASAAIREVWSTGKVSADAIDLLRSVTISNSVFADHANLMLGTLPRGDASDIPVKMGYLRNVTQRNQSLKLASLAAQVWLVGGDRSPATRRDRERIVREVDTHKKRLIECGMWEVVEKAKRIDTEPAPRHNLTKNASPGNEQFLASEPRNVSIAGLRRRAESASKNINGSELFFWLRSTDRLGCGYASALATR